MRRVQDTEVSPHGGAAVPSLCLFIENLKDAQGPSDPHDFTKGRIGYEWGFRRCPRPMLRIGEGKPQKAAEYKPSAASL